jgi:uroporphyrinogen decarboxylase
MTLEARKTGVPRFAQVQQPQPSEAKDSLLKEDPPLVRTLQGTPVWPPPVWLMRQAGRYLPEYRALRARAADFLAFCTTPALATEATLQPVRRFGLDGAILFSDILVLPWALGRPVAFAEGKGPVLAPLRSLHEVEALDPGRLPAAIVPVLETIRAVRSELPPTAALIGFAGAPFTLACYLVDGCGGDFLATRRMARENPSLFGSLIERLTEAAIPYLAAQVEAGAQALMLFDSWAGLLPPSLFRRLVIEPTARIAAAIKERYPHVPLIGFPRLAGLMLAPYAMSAGVDAVGLDTTAEPTLAADAVPPSVALQGNLDPLALLAGGPGMLDEAIGIASALRGRAHVFNLGHGVLPETPPAHVADLVRGLRAL